MPSEWNHTWQVGEPPAHKWNWTGPDLRQQVEAGMGIMTDDCAIYRVDDVLPDGLMLAPGIGRPFWSWDRLERSRCTPISAESARQMTG